MKTIIEMAREAGFNRTGRMVAYFALPEEIERFAALVRADEREACAKMCEAFGEMDLGVNSAAAAIRARGNT